VRPEMDVVEHSGPNKEELDIVISLGSHLLGGDVGISSHGAPCWIPSRTTSRLRPDTH
jgi:hypothetical protein